MISEKPGWKRPYLAPRVDRAQRKNPKGKLFVDPVESNGCCGGGASSYYGPS